MSDTHQEFLDRLTAVFTEKVPFHAWLGIKIEELNTDECRIGVSKQPEMVGNYVQQILHGGVTASLLDIAGGTMAAVGLMQTNPQSDLDELARKLAKLSTIDMRVDYVRPGRGDYFYAKARVLRTGSKVAVVRMELHNQKDTLIALGTGTYMVG